MTLGALRMTPDLTAVICTYNRPDLLRRALAAVDAQTYPGVIETSSCSTRAIPTSSLERTTGNRIVRTVRNAADPGLPGARNTGLRSARRAPVDRAVRRRRRVDAGEDHPPARRARRATRHRRRVHRHAGDDRPRPAIRIPDADRLTLPMLLRSRYADAHISSAMFRKDALFERIGLFDEVIPGGYCEDYEWTLRAARNGPIALVREPLVDIRWGTGSYFSDRWRTIDDAMGYLSPSSPSSATDPRGLARVQGQQAFARAAAGDRAEAWSKIRETMRSDWRQPRAYLAALVAARLVKPERVLAFLQRRGHGI